MTASVETRKMTVAGAIQEALDCALGLDESVVLLGEDIADPAGGVSKLTAGLSTKYGVSRVRNTPISEQAIIGAAIGAGLAGMRPVAEIMMMDFLGVCMDQVANHAAKLRYMTGGQTTVPITIRVGGGGGGGFGAQHSQNLEGWLAAIPGLKVLVPSTPADAKGMLLSAIFDPDPCVFIETYSLVFSQKGEVAAGDTRAPLGRGAVRRPGEDVTLVGYGGAMPLLLAAADRLEAHGLQAEVIDLRSLVPLDVDLVEESARKTGRVVVTHMAHTFMGPGAEIAAAVQERCFTDLKGPVSRVGAGPAPIPAAVHLEQALLPDLQTIVDAALRVASY